MHPISRIRVALNAAVLPFLALPKPLSFVGPDASLTLCRTIAGSGVTRILLVTDPALPKLGIADAMIEVLEAAGVSVDRFAEVQPDPGYELVLAGVERLRQSRAQAVIAVGGGSAIDCAKAIVMCQANDCHPAKLAGLWLYALPRKACLPFYAVPTTAGTGSEVTIAAVVSDHAAKSKRSLIDPKMVPTMIALDPKLTEGLPRFVTAATGIDALTHAIEAYLSTMATAETDGLARSAAASIVRALPAAHADGNDLQAREDMLVASCMAGLAFTRTGVGYVHAFAHQLGGRYQVPHGVANAILLPPCTRIL
jgi:alcohol dehydrogenase